TKCKSSVSKIVTHFGHICFTRQPNCSSVINRSYMTICGFNCAIKSSNDESFKTILCFSTPICSSGNDRSDSVAAVAKCISVEICFNCSINCNILQPAAEEVGSGITKPMINIRGFILQSTKYFLEDANSRFNL